MLSHFFRILLLLPLVILQVAALGQKQNIRVVVKDSADKKPIRTASLAILSKLDSAYLDFGIADTTGHYLFKNVNLAQAGFIATSVAGYEDKKIPLLPAQRGKTRLPDTTIEILLPVKYVSLQDVVVTGIPPIKMNKDTMEFNADYFKTQPNAVLEDLLRKLPGVEVRNGTEVYINGQRVSKILVDGKEFFSDDPVMILKNLPVEIISKIQVVDEKNTVAKETRQQDEIPKVINLKLKKDFRKGAFGKFFAGYGTHNRYEGGGLLNVFRDTLQVSFIGSSNNQGRGNSILQGNGDAFNSSLRDYSGSGITTSHLAGINLSYTLPKGVQVNGQYTYNQNRRLSGSETLSKQLLGDSAQLTNGNSSQTNQDATHKTGFRLRWKQDSTGYLSVSASANWNDNTYQSASGTTIYSEKVPLLSQSAIRSMGNSNRNTIAANADYSKTFEKLDLDWNINGSYSNIGGEQITTSNSRYIRLSNGLVPDSVIQQRENSIPNRQVSLSTSLNKNWKEAHSISWQADYSNLRDVTGGDTYQFFETSGKNELIPGLSVKLTQHKQRLSNQLSYRFNHKGFSIQPGISMRLLTLENSYNYDTIPVLNRTYHLVAPRFSINYKGISFNYNRNLQEPSAYALRPVTDSSNPLYISSGNPNLRPAKSNNFSLNYYHYFTTARINVNVWTSANQQTDAIGTSRQVFSDGKTVTGYVNLKKVISYNGGAGISKSYHKKNWDYSARLDNYLYISQSPLLLNGSIINTTATNINPAAEVGLNYKNKYRLQTNYRVSINRTRSDETTIQVANTVQHTVSGTLNLQFTKRFSWMANANYNINPNTTAGFKKQWLFCDMAVFYSFLKKERGQLKLSGYDIFNQNQGYYQYANLNNITNGRSLVQQQYFMLSFIYTVRKV